MRFSERKFISKIKLRQRVFRVRKARFGGPTRAPARARARTGGYARNLLYQSGLCPSCPPVTVSIWRLTSCLIFLEALFARAIFVNIAAMRSNNSRPCEYCISLNSSKRLHTSRILAHSVAERFAIL
jgi:hypothetical protein